MPAWRSGAAGVIASFVLFVFMGKETFAFMEDPAVVLMIKKIMFFLAPLLGLLMISKIEYIHFFNRFVRGRKTFNFLVQGVLFIFLVSFYHQWALLLCFFIYLVSGPVLALLHLKKKHSRVKEEKRTASPKNSDASS